VDDEQKIISVLRALVECVEAAISMGDWQVDGRADPDAALHMAKMLLNNEEARHG
jgi:hypothetical protein